MPEDQNRPRYGVKLLQCSLLPSFLQPLVFITWRNYTAHGDELLEVQYFIVHEDLPLAAMGVLTEVRYITATSVRKVTEETLVRIAENQALQVLEKLAAKQFRETPHQHAFFQPVALKEVSEEAVFITAQREGWDDKWKPILQRTYSPELRDLIARIQGSYMKDVSFSPLDAVR